MSRSAPESSTSASDAFASALGVSSADLPKVGQAFAAILDGLGVDGEAIFTRLCEGRPMAAALGAPPEAVPVLYARAHSWFAVGRPDKALVLFQGLCALAGDVADHWAGLGVCLKAQGRCAEAARVFEIAAQRRPEWALPHIHRAEAFLRLGDRRGARQALAEFEAREDARTPEPLRLEAERYRRLLAAADEAPRAGA